MKRNRWTQAYAVLLVAGMALTYAAAADFEVTGPDGRRILLKDDGTWQHLDAKDKAPAKGKPVDPKDEEPAKDKPKESGEAVLRLERKMEIGANCRFALRLVNNLPYEIRSLAPTFSAHRSNGVIFDSVLSIFQALKPGESQTRDVQFRGIVCQDIARVQVVGGDRCVMGELDRWALPEGQCLARVRVVESDLVRFDK